MPVCVVISKQQEALQLKELGVTDQRCCDYFLEQA